jgi:hypothetical protein
VANYTNEQIRAAFLRAADRIERAPGSYDFSNVFTPRGDGGCDSPHCMFGWLGHELGADETSSHAVAAIAYGNDATHWWRTADAEAFYRWCMERDKQAGRRVGAYQNDASAAADCMRAFANLKWPAVIADESRALVKWESCVWQPKQVRA